MALGISGLVDAWVPKIRAAFLRGVAAVRNLTNVTILARQVQYAGVEGGLAAVRLEPAMFRELERVVEDAYRGGGDVTAADLPDGPAVDGGVAEIVFDYRYPRAARYLAEHSAALVQGILEDQRAMVRRVLADGVAAERNPRSVALDLVGRINSATGNREGGLIGLTAAQEQWVRDYELELLTGDRNALRRNLRDPRFDRRVDRAIREGVPLPAAVRAKAVVAYRARALRYRAEAIATTEAQTALHAGQQEATEQAIEQGQVLRSTVTKEWMNYVDPPGHNRVRHTHRVLRGQRVAFDSPFVSVSGARLMFPGDPSAPAAERVGCRCYQNIRVGNRA